MFATSRSTLLRRLPTRCSLLHRHFSQSSQTPKLSFRSKVDLFIVVSVGFGTWIYLQSSDWDRDVLECKERLVLLANKEQRRINNDVDSNETDFELQVQSLPIPMKLYLDKVLPPNQRRHMVPLTTTARQTGSFFAAKEWYPFSSAIMASIIPGFVWEAHVEILNMPNRILQTFIDNKGSIITKAWGKVPMIQVEEEEPYMLFWLAMAPLCPQIFSQTTKTANDVPLIKWNSIQDLTFCSAQLVDECEDETFYLELYFHQDSKYLKSIKVESSKLLRSWQVNYEDYQDLDEGVIVPTRIEIGKWHGNEFKPHMNILNHHLKYDSRG